MTKIGLDDMAALARGAAVLGTGGGGDPYIGRLLAEQALRASGPIEVIPVDQLPDDACVIPVGMMGAPTVMVEKIPSAEQVGMAVTALADYLGPTATHIACNEEGGRNPTIPFLPPGPGTAATPMSIVDEKGNRGVLHTIDNHWAERLARTATIEMGCSAIVSLYAMTGAQVRRGV